MVADRTLLSAALDFEFGSNFFKISLSDILLKSVILSLTTCAKVKQFSPTLLLGRLLSDMIASVDVSLL